MQENKRKYFDVELEVRVLESGVFCENSYEGADGNTYGGDSTDDWGFDPFSD